MNKPHSFYRFGSAWNTGFFPQNQIASNQLNDIYVNVTTNISSWAIVGVSTVTSLYSQIKNLIQTQNQFPILGSFKTTLELQYSNPNDFRITILDPDLYVTDTSQFIEIIGEFVSLTNKTLTIPPVISSYTVGAYSGTFDSAHVPMEDEAINALNIVNDYGSAIMPLVYSYDQNTGIATSVLARASSYQLSNGAIARIPADTVPKINARRFTLPALSAEDKFAVTFMDKIMNASIGETGTTAISNAYNSLVMPDGWNKFFSYNPTTYERIQVTLENTNGTRVFALVGRFDVSWSWQRFVNDISENDSSFFINSYAATTQLPYEPTSGSRYIYFDTWYDFDFCDFTQECNVSPEFYAMPAIPGDIYQFNVPTDEGNLTSLTSVQVGLFQEDGGFIQKIGMAEKDCSFILNIPYLISPDSETGYMAWNDFIDTYVSVGALSFVLSNQQINYTGTSANSTVNSEVGPTIATLPSGSVLSYDKQLFIDAVEALTFPTNLKVKGTIINVGGNEIVQLKFYNFINIDYPSIQIQSSKLVEFDYFGFIDSLCCQPNQFKATVTIPAVKDGCYRFGIFDEPGESGGGGSCQLTFEISLNNPLFEIATKNNDYPGNYFSWAIFDGTNYTQVFQYPEITPISGGYYIVDNIVAYAQTIPGMSVFYDETTLTFTWTVTVDCGLNYQMWFGIMSATTSPIILIANSFSQECACEPVIIESYTLYSLSNIININRADCFSTMLEFWADDNTIAQGFEYSNGWKQKVRIGLNGGGAKPVIEESLYRQSNGVHKRPQNKQDLSLDLHTDFFDLETQLAMTDATRHPYIVWNGQPIFVNGDLEVATVQDFTTETSFEQLAQMKFQVLKQGFQPKNSSCLNC